jgi:acetyl-CoA carboxylase biotin carboxyl carrier protein
MAEGDTGGPGPFDLRTIRYLVRLMGRHEVTELDLRDGEQRIRLRRGMGSESPPPAAAIPAAVPALAAAPPPTAAAAPPAAPAAEAPAKKYIEIKSPTPGTFYGSPNPESPAYVQVGSPVKPDTVVCIIEAMKVFNEITADCTGTIAAVLVENQQPVEYGQVLFKVDPTG